MGRPIIWAQALVIVCAYCFYKGAQNWSLYAVQVLGMDEVQAAQFTALGAYVRPIAALSAGVIADRIGATRSIGACFVSAVRDVHSIGGHHAGTGRDAYYHCQYVRQPVWRVWFARRLFRAPAGHPYASASSPALRSVWSLWSDSRQKYSFHRSPAGYLMLPRALVVTSIYSSCWRLSR